MKARNYMYNDRPPNVTCYTFIQKKCESCGGQISEKQQRLYGVCAKCYKQRQEDK